MRNILYPCLIIIVFYLQSPAFGQRTDSFKDVQAPYYARIVSDETDICLGNSVEAIIFFSGGTAPWDVVINDKDGEYVVLENITNPYTLWLKPEEDNTYYIASVEDRKGIKGDCEGEVVVTVHLSTPVSIQMDRTAYLYSEPGVLLTAIPSGGAFFGNGVSGSMFYPGIATPVGSPHNITCTYTNQYGCVSTDEIDIHVLYGAGDVYLLSGNDTINTICDDAVTYIIKGSNQDNIPGLFELREANSTVAIPGHIKDEDLLDDMADFDPDGLSGAYDIIYTYGFQELTVTSSYRFVVNDLGTIKILDLPDAVCKNDDPYPLVPELSENDPGAIYTFSGPGVSGNQADGFFYDPGDPDAPVGKNEITMVYTSSNGCLATTTQVVINKFVPDVKFSLTPVCLPADGGTVTFNNMTSGKYSVESWSWDFGDPESGDNNYSDLEHPEHFYGEPGSRQISLTATTTEGCVVRHTEDTVLTDQPVADFTWLTDCFVRGTKTAVVDRSTSTFSAIDTFVWTFKTDRGGVLGVIGTSSTTDTVEFPFTSLDNYLIELHIRNEVGCQGEVTKEIVLKPTIMVTAAGYNENFNGDNTNWLSGSEDQNESWTLDVPDFTGFVQVPGDMAWYTDLPATFGYLEQSWVESPCFDFSEVKKPLIQLDVMKSFVPGEDGAVLQYQEFVSEEWKIVGNVGEGINWYNETGISNEPGGSSFGWGLDPFNPDTDWVNAGHDLHMLAGNHHVKFRVTIATGGTQEIGNQGFAFDNVFIGERIRRSVLEHFTNSADAASREADGVVDTFAMDQSGKVIDLQYHMDYPGYDPMNANNPYPASTRSFQNGVPGVPYAVLNGGTQPDHRYDFSDPSNEPDEETLKKASLEIPLFEVVLTVDWRESSLETTARVTCMVDTFASYLDLYVAVIESSVTAYTGLNQDTMFRNVVLDMLPTPAGKLLGNEWYNGKTDSRTYTWDYAAYVEDIEDLAVVAFVKVRDNGPILQVASNYLTPQVGIPDRRKEPGSLVIYPNPAVDHLYVNFGSQNENEGQLMIMDLSGKVVLTMDVQPGYSIHQLDVSNLSQGMYMIYWFESGVLRGRNKLVRTR
ncbi:MAG: T9SS type A sorting domain-containing protein [Bacteroidales bacterium]|nr:T9SS type A sorting domain-containing protein [Bacteroidales bacterium]